MDPLYDQRGRVYAWLETATGRFIGLGGQQLAFLAGDNVYNWSGAHLGWWEHGHMRDRRGAVVVFLANATNLIVGKPGLSGRPGIPGISGVPGRPGLSGVPGRPGNAGGWTKQMPF